MNVTGPKISYSIKRSRQARRVSIVVHCNAVIVTAPFRASERSIQQFVDTQRKWIQKTLCGLQKRRQPWVTPPDVLNDTFHTCQARAKKFIRDRIVHCNEVYRFHYARISVKDMKSRWGSCSEQKNLNFHYRLLFLPLELADYVIVHELCHLREMNHSQRFWRLVEKAVPDHPARRARLRQYAL